MLSVLFLLMLPSCSLLKKTEGKEKLVEPASSTVKITAEALEIETTSGDKYVFPGNGIEGDRGISVDSAKEQLQAQKKRGALCSSLDSTLTLEFPDALPDAVKCYNHYYLDDDAQEFLYTDLQKTITVAEVKATTAIPIGMDMASAVSAVLSPVPHYRIVRIVCEFGEQTVEYYIFAHAAN